MFENPIAEAEFMQIQILAKTDSIRPQRYLLFNTAVNMIYP